MKSYADLINQTFYFPTEEFTVQEDRLFFHKVDLMEIINTYGTPLKLSYLPKISDNIQKAKAMFAEAIKKHNYPGKYHYCYCTKSSHFSFVMEEALKNNIHIETSSGYDIPIIRAMVQKGKLPKEAFIICNGFKRPLYTQYISELLNEGFTNCIPVLDNLEEIKVYNEKVTTDFKVGIRVAADEEPNFGFYTSRLGIRYNDIMGFYQESLQNHPHAKLKLLHFFINTGIRDTAYYWHELAKFLDKYCELKQVCPDLDSIDIGGGFPIKTSLHFEYDYAYMIEQIIELVKDACDSAGVEPPHIFTEFGSFTVGESGATIYSVLDQKLQNDKELWYMIDGSFITQMPDVWGLNQKYIMLAVNQWGNRMQKVSLGGLTCDSMDYYNAENHDFEVFMPRMDNENPLYIGFFHTGAYQESLGGYGGIQHCLIPAPKHIIIHEEAGALKHYEFAPEQSSDSMMKVLGY